MKTRSRDKYKTKADVVAYVKKSFADGAAAIKAKGDQGMNDLVIDSFAHQQVRVYDMAYGFIEHCVGTLRTTGRLFPSVGPGSPGVAPKEVAGYRQKGGDCVHLTPVVGK